MQKLIFHLIMALAWLLSIYQPCFSQLSKEPEDGFMAGQPEKSSPQQGSLLFYLSGNSKFDADFTAAGQSSPNFLKDVILLTQGAKGSGFRAEDSQLMSYWAPGNIYAQRGTLAFFWRSRYAVGKTPFPIFRVGYADHSSWDMVWLRIDYNGSGFDAFVTDVGLSRTRVSYEMEAFPGPDEWIHLAISWDETEGIRFYVNGELVAKQSVSGTLYDSGLDQLGPHSRIISPYQVQSAYSFMRGGDIDELCIYDRMVTDEVIAEIAAGQQVKDLPPFARDLNERRWRDEWWLRNGWNLPNSPPQLLPSQETGIRKVEIHDAWDIKRWYWKANDGIRETTWPGVYNMSRLPGRYDYFVLPDWDCYSGSGQSVKFSIPDEPWNHVEIYGKAWGQITLETDEARDLTFGMRSQKQIKSWHTLAKPQKGGSIRFDNALIEEPIGSFDTYFVSKKQAPSGTKSERFVLTPAGDRFENKALQNVASFVRGRYPSDERSLMLGIRSEDAKSQQKSQSPEPALSNTYPFIHILIPFTYDPDSGLDGIEIKLPRLDVKPTHSGVFPVNIRIKDPLWLMRDLADFSFSVKPGDSPTLWIDTRDRILPPGRALYITMAGAGTDFSAGMLKGTVVRLVFKSKKEARSEHEADRLTQIRDLFAMIVEERPNTPRLNLYNRFIADCNDLLSVNPDHQLAQSYLYAFKGGKKPDYKIAACPEGIPEWAFLQVEYLRHLERISSYYIDKRQIANGEFGGGLSDDGDLTNMWPGIAFLGINPDKLLRSLLLHMDAYYDQERMPDYSVLKQRSLPLFTNGLATIFTDELHALEEGIQVVAQSMLFDYGTPLHIERGMETASRLLHDITGVNKAGHRHFRSRYYGATRIADEDPWQWSNPNSYHVLQSAYLVARYNGNPELRKMITEIADGLLAHMHNGVLQSEINFATDEAKEHRGMGRNPWPVLYAAYGLTGDKKYHEPAPPLRPWIRDFNKEKIAESYRSEIKELGVKEFINTEGSIWIDRISAFNPLIQEDRLGGVALTRTNVLYPRHLVSWKFNTPATFESAAIFLSEAAPDAIDIIAWNLEQHPVNAEMSVWEIKPGKWRVRQGIDTNDDQVIDGEVVESVVDLVRGDKLNITFAPRQYNIVSLELLNPAEKSYGELPDLGIGPRDISIKDDKVTVRVHSLGAAASSASIVVLKDAQGKQVAAAPVPPLEAPLDLIPRWIDIILQIPEGTDLSSGAVLVDPEKKMKQITRQNTVVTW